MKYILLIATLFSVSNIQGADVPLHWGDNSDNERGFSVEASKDGGEFVVIAQTAENVSEYTHNIPETERDVVYTYCVRAFNYSGYSGYTNTLDIKGKYFSEISGDSDGLKINTDRITINANNVTVNQN